MLYSVKLVRVEPSTCTSDLNKAKRKIFAENLIQHQHAGDYIVYLDETNHNIYCHRSAGRAKEGDFIVFDNKPTQSQTEERLSCTMISFFSDLAREDQELPGRSQEIPDIEALVMYMHKLRAAERAVTCTHLINILKRNHPPRLDAYMAVKKAGLTYDYSMPPHAIWSVRGGTAKICFGEKISYSMTAVFAVRQWREASHSVHHAWQEGWRH
ncbi:hypothetical protein H310_14595 [Aphanomyces invadans]|uniref:Tc1-like transposase DDE domain-containing protein n=1 Tax=Aphanomyces invadans TaxID=157072 RepID=A0A024T8Z7_9STRA|nr:hypothetical protein H310_14595 [Aphanomyces invadans]ETV90630.1 hypothetical protein H310_14595 [Aphanomyces invadans]|eukprot:XP_008880700.1 hypothetical protein H310_14595 [Aphanomyces invadans]